MANAIPEANFLTTKERQDEMATPTQNAALTKALAYLKLADAQFHIIDADGVSHGEIKALDRKRGPIENRGVTQFAWDHVGGLEPGGATTITCDEFPIVSVQASLTSKAFRVWGEGSVETTKVGDKTLMVIRVK